MVQTVLARHDASRLHTQTCCLTEIEIPTRAGLGVGAARCLAGVGVWDRAGHNTPRVDSTPRVHNTPRVPAIYRQVFSRHDASRVSAYGIALNGDDGGSFRRSIRASFSRAGGKFLELYGRSDHATPPFIAGTLGVL